MSIVPTVSIAHNANGCPMDKIDVQWTQWTSMLRRFMTQLGVTVIFIVICDLCRPVSWFPCYTVCEAYIFLVTYKIHETRGSVCIE